ncbi:hypothetical protein G8A07_06965 [Roseateles sp. DAIF2]|uniref:DUF7673 family protein n=1 Tax=Roseateles sp. DAIF2 TaxID=2714952 RepID=UPI0018A26896|nr:hypothetical protein [Roseateles sp. DAIF2]QPF72694.1 hypothetical protein G8A07_06965 [Roseateles sp. DAIF2]
MSDDTHPELPTPNSSSFASEEEEAYFLGLDPIIVLEKERESRSLKAVRRAANALERLLVVAEASDDTDNNLVADFIAHIRVGAPFEAESLCWLDDSLRADVIACLEGAGLAHGGIFLYVSDGHNRSLLLCAKRGYVDEAFVRAEAVVPAKEFWLFDPSTGMPIFSPPRSEASSQHSDSKEEAVNTGLLATEGSHASTYERLDELLRAWPQAEDAPHGVGVLSGGEYRALALARGHHRLLHDPIGDFLILDDWLQRWVLHHRGLLHMAGWTVG